MRGLRTVLRSKDAALGGLKQETQRLARRLGAAEAETRRRAAEADRLRKARAELAAELERERRNKAEGRAGRAARREPPGRDEVEEEQAARLQFDLEARKNEARLLRGEVRNLKILLRSKDQALGRLKKEAGRLAERLDEAQVAIRHREAEVSHSPKGWVGGIPQSQTTAWRPNLHPHLLLGRLLRPRLGLGSTAAVHPVVRLDPVRGLTGAKADRLRGARARLAEELRRADAKGRQLERATRPGSSPSPGQPKRLSPQVRVPSPAGTRLGVAGTGGADAERNSRASTPDGQVQAMKAATLDIASAALVASATDPWGAPTSPTAAASPAGTPPPHHEALVATLQHSLASSRDERVHHVRRIQELEATVRDLEGQVRSQHGGEGAGGRDAAVRRREEILMM